MVKVKKTFGENPETVVVLAEAVRFDENGEAEVSEEIADILKQIPGYAFEAEEPEVDEEEDASEEEDAPKKSTRKPAPRKPAPKK